MTLAPSQTGGGPVQNWPLPIATQAAYITTAIAKWGVPVQVFMGMYSNESNLGTNPNTGLGGPFQMTDPGTRAQFGYPPTPTPNSTEFGVQADGAAHYLHNNYVSIGGLSASNIGLTLPSWQNALAAYNAGPGGFRDPKAQVYATKALAFQIPANWKAALAGAPGGTPGGGGPATPGGTVGAGGTGTLPNDVANFTVGDPSNPDEDFWTAINRLAQERYWYVFSDGESMYLADGPDLMKQTPAMEVDRVADAGRISHLEFTFDNTAWTYSATHKKRRRSQRRTALAKVTSPVEGLMNTICKIDEVRAGDVIVFDNCGPGDGQWLVGDCRRSVFEVTSEITVVPALTPLSEGELNPAGVNKSNANVLNSLVSTVNSKGYANPVGAWSPSRIDQGVDGTLTGTYVAPGDSQMVSIYNSQGSGSWEGYWIAGMFTSGSLKGKCWYVAEGVTPLINQGAAVKAGTPVARPGPTSFGAPGLIETGWANPSAPSNTLAKALPGWSGDDQSPQAMACGNSFNRFLIKLGAKPGAAQGRGVGVAPAPMPGGYP